MKLWQQLVSFLNLVFAFEQASKGKRSKVSVSAFEKNLEENLFSLQNELENGTYRPGDYVNFYIHDPKRRLISASPFRDRVVHHALMNVTARFFERKFIFDTYANRIGKGTHRALDRCTYYMRRFQYVLPLDVRQYFPSIDHQVLNTQLQGTLYDERVLELCQTIIAGGSGVLAKEYDMVYFPNDDLFAADRPRGLPIGNLTSQFWENVYLNGLDHFIKRHLKCAGYIRYVDDMVLFSDSKKDLHDWKTEISDYMAGLRLTIHARRAQPRPCRIGLPFLGFQVFPDHRLLKRRKGVLARRKFKSMVSQIQKGEADSEQLRAALIGWINHVRYGDTWGLRLNVLKELGKTELMKYG